MPMPIFAFGQTCTAVLSDEGILQLIRQTLYFFSPDINAMMDKMAFSHLRQISILTKKIFGKKSSVWTFPPSIIQLQLLFTSWWLSYLLCWFHVRNVKWNAVFVQVRKWWFHDGKRGITAFCWHWHCIVLYWSVMITVWSLWKSVCITGQAWVIVRCQRVAKSSRKSFTVGTSATDFDVGSWSEHYLSTVVDFVMLFEALMYCRFLCRTKSTTGLLRVLESPWKSSNISFQIFKARKVLENRHGPWKSLNLCLKVLESAWVWFSKTPWPNKLFSESA